MKIKNALNFSHVSKIIIFFLQEINEATDKDITVQGWNKVARN